MTYWLKKIKLYRRKMILTLTLRMITSTITKTLLALSNSKQLLFNPQAVCFEVNSTIILLHRTTPVPTPMTQLASTHRIIPRTITGTRARRISPISSIQQPINLPSISPLSSQVVSNPARSDPINIRSSVKQGVVGTMRSYPCCRRTTFISWSKRSILI